MPGNRCEINIIATAGNLHSSVFLLVDASALCEQPAILKVVIQAGERREGRRREESSCLVTWETKGEPR